MLVQKNFLNKLKDFGLNSYEAKIWTALLSRGVSTAGELSDIANVPRSRSYDVLESLEKKGFIILKMGKPIKYIAVAPEEVVDRVKKRVKNEADDHVKMLEETKKTDVLKDLQFLYKQGGELVNPLDLTGIIKGRRNIYNHLDQLIKNAKKTIVMSTTSDGLARKMKHLGKSLEYAKKKNVDIKIFAPITPNNEEVVKQLNFITNIKNMSIRDSRFFLFDNKELVFMLLDDKETHPDYDTAVWVNTEQFGQGLNYLLENLDTKKY